MTWSSSGLFLCFVFIWSWRSNSGLRIKAETTLMQHGWTLNSFLKAETAYCCCLWSVKMLNLLISADLLIQWISRLHDGLDLSWLSHKLVVLLLFLLCLTSVALHAQTFRVAICMIRWGRDDNEQHQVAWSDPNGLVPWLSHCATN